MALPLDLPLTVVHRIDFFILVEYIHVRAALDTQIHIDLRLVSIRFNFWLCVFVFLSSLHGTCEAKKEVDHLELVNDPFFGTLIGEQLKLRLESTHILVSVLIFICLKDSQDKRLALLFA